MHSPIVCCVLLVLVVSSTVAQNDTSNYTTASPAANGSTAIANGGTATTIAPIPTAALSNDTSTGSPPPPNWFQKETTATICSSGADQTCSACSVGVPCVACNIKTQNASTNNNYFCSNACYTCGTSGSPCSSSSTTNVCYREYNSTYYDCWITKSSPSTFIAPSLQCLADQRSEAGTCNSLSMREVCVNIDGKLICGHCCDADVCQASVGSDAGQHSASVILTAAVLLAAVIHQLL